MDTRQVGSRFDKRRKPQSIFLPELFCVSQDEDSHDDPAALSLPGMSPVESIHSDEELLLDQIKDFKSPFKPEGAVVITLCDVSVQYQILVWICQKSDLVLCCYLCGVQSPKVFPHHSPSLCTTLAPCCSLRPSSCLWCCCGLQGSEELPPPTSKPLSNLNSDASHPLDFCSYFPVTLWLFQSRLSSVLVTKSVQESHYTSSNTGWKPSFHLMLALISHSLSVPLECESIYCTTFWIKYAKWK